MTSTSAAAGGGAPCLPLAVLTVGGVLGRTVVPADALIKAAPRGAWLAAEQGGARSDVGVSPRARAGSSE
jgi:hypothetical protein